MFHVAVLIEVAHLEQSKMRFRYYWLIETSLQGGHLSDGAPECCGAAAWLRGKVPEMGKGRWHEETNCPTTR